MSHCERRFCRTKVSNLADMMLCALSCNEDFPRDRHTLLYVTDERLQPGTIITFINDKRILMGTERFHGAEFRSIRWVNRIDHPPQVYPPPEETFNCVIHQLNPDDGILFLCWCVRRDSIQDEATIRNYIFTYITSTGSLSTARLILRERAESLFPEFDVVSWTTMESVA